MIQNDILNSIEEQIADLLDIDVNEIVRIS